MEKLKEMVEKAKLGTRRINNDFNGNPRYAVNYQALGLPSGESTKKTREAGLHKLKQGDFHFTSYELNDDLEYILMTLHGELE